MPSSIIRGKRLLVRIDPSGEPVIVDDGALFQQDGVIVAVGSFADIRERFTADEIVGSEHHVVLPGLVNSHHHLGLTPLQLGVPDLPLELWIAARIGMRSVDPYLDTLYSAFEMIESGVTTVQHLHGRVPLPLMRMERAALAVIGAYEAIGMRVSYSYGIRDQNHLVYGDDKAFGATLSAGLAPAFHVWLQSQTVPVEDSLALFDSLYQRYQDSERVRIQLAPVNLHWCSDETLVRLNEHAQKSGVPLHMHLLETDCQREYARRRTGGSAVDHLSRLGLLGPHLTLGHCVWVTASDIEVLAASGTCVCHNLSSNMRLGSGHAPVPAMQQAGIRVAIGIDEAGINDDRDMLLEMRLVMGAHRGAGHPDKGLAAGSVYRMASENGAHTTPFGARIGTLEPGRRADLALIDWRALAEPYLDERVPLLDAVLHRAKSRMVDTVIVDGEVILRAGKFTRIDKDSVIAELSRSLAAPLDEPTRARIQLAEAVLPEVREYYRMYRGDA
jgi:cytosine/adenosine deaminase-related metal-dependent hydrolase